MNKLVEIALVVVSVSAVAVADVLIKKVAVNSPSFSDALKSPWMLPIGALYILQILIFLYVFEMHAELGIVGIIQTALYALIVIGSGILFFNETVTLVQGVGMALALSGVVLMNI